MIGHVIGPTQVFGSFLLEAALKSTLFLCFLLLVDRCLPRRLAAWRNLLWRMGTAALLLVPLASTSLPPLHLSLPQGWLETPVAETVMLRDQLGPPVAGRVPLTLPAVEPEIPPPAATTPHTLPLSSRQAGTIAMVVLYLAGLGWMSVRFGLGILATVRLRRHSAEIAGQEVSHDLSQMRARLGIRRPVQVRTCEYVSGPTQVGIFAAQILLPPEHLSELDAQSLRSVLIHELAHVRRQDYLFNLLSQLALTLHWLNPLAWLATGRLRQTTEQVCDDWTVELTGDRDTYAHTLLEVASRLRPKAILALGANMASSSFTAQRIERILSQKGRVFPRTTRTVGIACILVLGGGAIAIGAADLNGTPATGEASSEFHPPLARLLYVASPSQLSNHHEYRIMGFPGCAPPNSEIRFVFVGWGPSEVLARAGADGAFSFPVSAEILQSGFRLEAKDPQGQRSATMTPRLDHPAIGGSFREPNDLGWVNTTAAAADEEDDIKSWENIRGYVKTKREKQQAWLRNAHEQDTMPDSVQWDFWSQLERTGGYTEPGDLKVYGYAPFGRWATCIVTSTGRSFKAQVREDGRFSIVLPQDAVVPNRHEGNPTHNIPDCLVNLTGEGGHLLAIYGSWLLPPWAKKHQQFVDTESLLGQPAPDFALASLDGKEVVQLGTLKGQSVLIYIWTSQASQLVPYLDDLPAIQQLHLTVDRAKLRLLTVHTTYGERTYAEDLRNAQTFMNDHGYTFPVLVDPDFTFRRSYKVWWEPRMMIIDREGIVRYAQDGPMSEEKLKAALAEYLN